MSVPTHSHAYTLKHTDIVQSYPSACVSCVFRFRQVILCVFISYLGTNLAFGGALACPNETGIFPLLPGSAFT